MAAKRNDYSALTRRVLELKRLAAESRGHEVPPKSRTKKAKFHDWTLNSLRGVPGGRGAVGMVKMISSPRTGTRVLSDEKVRELPSRVAPPTTSFSYERGGYQRVERSRL